MDNQMPRYTANGIEKPKEPDFLAEMRVLTRVRELCILRARPKIIHSLVGGRTEKTLVDFGRMFKEVTQIAPPKGQLPASPEPIMSNSEKKLHASFIIRQYIKLELAGLDYAEALFRSYLAYVRLFKTTPVDAPISFDHAFRLIDFLKNGLFNQVKCKDCKLTYLKFANVPIAKNSCPVCAGLRNRPALLRQLRKK